MNERDKEIGANVRRLRKESGLTQSQVAEVLGYSSDNGRATISKIESGQQGLSGAQAGRLAKLFKCNVNEILPNDSSSQVTVSPYSFTKPVKIVGVVQAGLWMPVEDTFADSGETVRVSEDACPGDRGYFALTVRGTSMNLRFPPGTTLLCCPLSQFPELRDGLYVIVRRCRHGDAEITVKRYQETEDGRFLMPETSDPKWAGPVRYVPEDERVFDDGGIPTIEIVAVVVSSIQKHV